jgi:carboxypeptidase Taq
MALLDPIISHLKSIYTLQQISAVLSWDQETMMPQGAIHARADQLACISGNIHDAWNAPAFATALATCVNLDTGEPVEGVSDEDRAFLREVYPLWQRETQLTKELVESLAIATSTAQHTWQQAREQNNFGLFQDSLAHMVDLQQQKSAQLRAQGHPYNAHLAIHEPGMSVAKIDPLFAELKDQTVSFLDQYQPKSVKSLTGSFNIDAQRAYSVQMAELMQYDFNRGRLDASTHPFTIDIHPTDVRITTRYSESDFLEAISSTMHEVGHALYEQGLPQEWAGTPFGMARSMAVHESQSRLWELFIGQSEAFWTGQLPTLNTLFPAFQSYTAQDLVTLTHGVKPHWCRVASDIVTYNLHIILRYECEKDLISGALSVRDLPRVWNQKMQDYLGIQVDSDAQGCLQDVHWSAGLFGYFPSYTLGTMISAELFGALQRDIFDLDNCIQSGKFEPIHAWLLDNVYRHGCRLTTQELLEKLSVEYNVDRFMDRLRQGWG